MDAVRDSSGLHIVVTSNRRQFALDGLRECHRLACQAILRQKCAIKTCGVHSAKIGHHGSDTYRIWVVCGCDTLAVEQEPHTLNILSLPVAEGIHELSKSSSALDLEEHFIVVVGDLDVEMLALSSILWLLSNVWRSVVPV